MRILILLKVIKENGIDWLIRITEFLLVLTIILDCNSVYRLRTGWEGNPRYIAIYVANTCAYTLIALWVLKSKKNIECIKELLLLIMINCIFVFEFNTYNVYVRDTGFVGYFLFFITAMVVLYRINKSNGEPFRMLYLMEHVILFIAVISTILWIGWNILGLWGISSDLEINWGGIYYDTNYLNFSIRRWFFDGDFHKNLGIFVEPPMFGLFLCFGLYTELFLKKKSNPLIVLSFTIALISCGAILALMIAILGFFFAFAELIKDKKGARALIVVMSLMAILGMTGLFIYKYKTGWGSFATHIDDFVASFKCWLDYPILGCGFYNEWTIQEYMSDFRLDNLGLSNSGAVVLAEGGIILFTYYFLPFLLLMLSFFKKNRKMAYWSVGIFALWFVIIFHARLFIFFLIALGYSVIDFRVHVFSTQSDEKKVRFKLLSFDENISSDEQMIEKKMTKWLIMPNGFIVMMFTTLIFFLAFGMINFKKFSIINFVVSFLIFALGIIAFIYLCNKRSINKIYASLVLIGFWLFYMIVGQPYKVIDYFLTVSCLHIQDGFLMFPGIMCIAFGIGILLDRLTKNFFE